MDQATDALDRGDYVSAGKRVIDAHRLSDRSRVRRHDADPRRGARLVVTMAEQAVQLTNRLPTLVPVRRREGPGVGDTRRGGRERLVA